MRTDSEHQLCAGFDSSPSLAECGMVFLPCPSSWAEKVQHGLSSVRIGVWLDLTAQTEHNRLCLGCSDWMLSSLWEVDLGFVILDVVWSKEEKKNKSLLMFQSLFHFLFSYSIEFSTVPQHKMQHAENWEKTSQTELFKDFPTQTENTPNAA